MSQNVSGKPGTVQGVNRRTAERMRNTVMMHFDLEPLQDGRSKRWRIAGRLGRMFTKPTAEELATLQSEVDALHASQQTAKAEILSRLLRKIHSALDQSSRNRAAPDIEALTMAQRVIELANASDDGLTTYGELWASFNPDKPWKGNATQQIVGNALGRVTAYCITNKMPIITTLVVRSGSRTLSDEAIINITNEARGLGVETGSDPRVFVESQMAAAKALTQFPSEEPAG